MFRDLKIGDYVLISSGFYSSKLMRKKVCRITKTTFKCENDLYTYNRSNGKAWGMSYRYAKHYDEEVWQHTLKAKSLKERRNRAEKIIYNFQEGMGKYDIDILEIVAKAITESTSSNN